MNRSPDLDVRVPLGAIAKFSEDGQVYRAYAHALAAARGMLLLVPIELVNGDLTELVDACPVPWEEVIAILEEPDRSPRPLAEHESAVSIAIALKAILDVAPNWDVDSIRVGTLGAAEVWRISHASGIRCAVLQGLFPSKRQ